MKVVKTESKRKPFKPENVEIRDVLVADLIKAEQACGQAQGYEFLCGVISQCSLFDGQAQPPEEVQQLGMKDFLTLTDELGLNGREISPDTSSTSSGKESLESQPS